MRPCPCNERCELHGWLDGDQFCRALGGGQRDSDWFSRLTVGGCEMRCEWCHGRMFVDGQPCTHCLGGQTSCCEGPVCEIEVVESQQVELAEAQQLDFFDGKER